MSEKSESPHLSPQTESENSLIALGFELIPGTQMYIKDQFVIDFDSKTNIPDIRIPTLTRRPEQISGIKKLDTDELALITVTRSGDYVLSTKNSTRGVNVMSGFGIKYVKSEGDTPFFIKGSLANQAVKAGFKQSEKNDNVFRQESIVAIFNSPSSVRSFSKPIEKENLWFLTEPPQFTDSKHSDAKNETHLGIETDALLCAINSGTGDVVENTFVLKRALSQEELPYEIPKYTIAQPISDLTHINNIDVTELEKIMYPNGSSIAGFLAHGERLKDVLQRDDAYVRSLGLKHEQLAEPLQYILAIADKGVRDFQFPWKGRNYKVAIIARVGFQRSPFRDGTSGSLDMTVTDMETNEQINTSDLLGEMIGRYGFYEGTTRFRLDPKDILRVFPNIQSAVRSAE